MKRFGQLVLLRHGESQWNKENRFTGWVDVDLSPKGEEEARQAGQLLKAEGFEFDQVYTSVLKRAIRTLWLALSEMGQEWLPVIKDWRLNERHYGQLQGLNKAETSQKYGQEQVFTWRRSYDTPPPPLDSQDPGHPRFDRRYANLAPESLPQSEALKQTKQRVMPLWTADILPQLEAGKNILIVAHGNSLRALIKELEGISDEAISELNLPTGIPLLYQLQKNEDGALKVFNKKYLGDPQAAEKAAQAVAQQAQAGEFKENTGRQRS